MNQKLASKVNARNQVNALSNEKQLAIRTALLPFVGHKVRLAAGGMTTKVAAALAPFASDARCARIWFSVREYGLEARFVVTVGSEHGSTCQEYGCDLGRVSNGILTNLHDQQALRTDWTVEEVEKARTDAQAAREAMHAAEWQFRHFGTHDHN